MASTNTRPNTNETSCSSSSRLTLLRQGTSQDQLLSSSLFPMQRGVPCRLIRLTLAESVLQRIWREEISTMMGSRELLTSERRRRRGKVRRSARCRRVLGRNPAARLGYWDLSLGHPRIKVCRWDQGQEEGLRCSKLHNCQGKRLKGSRCKGYPRGPQCLSINSIISQSQEGFLGE